MSVREILVGVDGSPAAGRALRWATREAGRRGLPLRIVYAFDWQQQHDSGGCLDASWQAAEALTAAAAGHAADLDAAVPVRTDLRPGRPAVRLLEQTCPETLLVVGNRGHGTVAGALLGSVSSRVATHARGPVAVVRGRAGADTGPVVVGLDDSDAAERVLDVAFQAAGERDAPLVVIRTYLPITPVWVPGMPVVPLDGQTDAEQHARLQDLVAPWRDKYPAVPVETHTPYGGPGPALVGLSRRAQLVVVGTHGRGTLAGALLGSTSRHLLHHADCPVLVVPASPR